MSIHFVSGKPGGGKTLYGMRLILDELIKGTRTIVTNVSIKLPELNAYLQEHYPAFYKREFEFGGSSAVGGTGDIHRVDPLEPPGLVFPRHITDRIIVIGEDDLGEFFTHRGNGVRLESVSNVEWKAGKRPDFSKVTDAGVFYVLDEVHIAFNSRAWADTGAEVLYYLSQHRKLGDDVICITQAIANVDKQFRSVAQDYTYIKNLSKQRAGIFRLPSLFWRHTYAQPATDTSKPMESGTFSLDVYGIASLYDTAKGVGIHGRAGADTNARKKGLSWIWFVVGVPVLLYVLVHFFPGLVMRILHPGSQVVPAVQSPHVSPLPTPGVSPVGLLAPGSGRELTPVRQGYRQADMHAGRNDTQGSDFVRYVGTSPDDTNVVYCTGYTAFDGLCMVFLSDGSTAYSDAGEVQTVTPRWVRVFDHKYRVVLGSSVASSESGGFSSPGAFSSTADLPVRPGSVAPVVSSEGYSGSVEILPSIHSIASAMVSPGRLNGFSGQSLAATHFQNQ